MNEQQIREQVKLLAELSESSTLGPWEVEVVDPQRRHDISGQCDPPDPEAEMHIGSLRGNREDADFIVSTRNTDFAAILALLDAKDAKIRELSESIALGPGANIIKEQSKEIERLEALNKEVSETLNAYGAIVNQLRKDFEAASGECLVDIPEPGTDAAKLLIANALLRKEIERLREKNERLKQSLETEGVEIEDDD